MAPHRRIDAAGLVQLVLAHDLLIKRLPHAMQALELEAAVIARHHRDRRERMRIVRGELRIEHIPPGQQVARASQIADISRNLAGEQRIGLEALLLRALHLRVPIGALDKPHGNYAACLFREFRQPLQHRLGPLRIGLHRKPQAVPALEPLILRQPAEEFERQVEPVHLLRIDGEAHIQRLGLHSKIGHARQKLRHHAGLLLFLIARVKGGELHRDRGTREDVSPPGPGPQRLQRIAIGGEVAPGILHGEGGFAQHVIGEAVALRFQRCGDRHRLVNRPPQHELFAHDAHGLLHGIADDGLARARHQLLEVGAHIAQRHFSKVHEAPRQHQPPGGSIDEERVGLAKMAFPILAAHLVGDQLVGGLGIGNPEQRLGQAHQHHALFGGERVFLHEGIDAALLRAPCPDRGHELPGQFRHALLVIGGQRRLGGEYPHSGGFIGKQAGGNGGAAGQCSHGRTSWMMTDLVPQSVRCFSPNCRSAMVDFCCFWTFAGISCQNYHRL